MNKTAKTRDSFWDGPKARGLALMVIVLCGAFLGYVHREDLLPADDAKTETGLNPEFVKCRNQRIGQVEKMRKDKVINDGQYQAFRARALAFCTAQFPPEGNKAGRPPGLSGGLPKR